jgi:hypothetical protein
MLGVFGATRPTDCFLSIGTGIDANSALIQPGKYRVPLPGSLRSFANVATNGEMMHVLFRGLINAFAPWPGKQKYWRLNVHKVVEAWYETIHPGWFDRYFLWRGDQVVYHHQNYEAMPGLDNAQAARERLMDMLREYLGQVQVGESIRDCAIALGD